MLADSSCRDGASGARPRVPRPARRRREAQGRREALRSAAALSCLLLISRPLGAAADNCGTWQCPSGYVGVNSPSAVDCGGVCTNAQCCVEIGCSTDIPTIDALLTARNAQRGSAVISSCNGVAEGSCTVECRSGYGAAAAPTLTCTGANNWEVVSSCALITCALPYPCTSIDCGVDVTACDTLVESNAIGGCGAGQGISCRSGYTGTAQLTCAAGTGSVGVWTLSGSCTETACDAFQLSVGMETGTSDPCPLDAFNRVPSGTLKPVSDPSCSLRCQNGYTPIGVERSLSCTSSASFPAPTTDLVCTELVCVDYRLPEGVIGSDGPGGCPSTNGVVPAGTLSALTRAECALMCLPGYTGVLVHSAAARRRLLGTTATVTITLPTITTTSTVTLPTQTISTTMTMTLPTASSSMTATVTLPTATVSLTATLTLPSLSSTVSATVTLPTTTVSISTSLTLPTMTATIAATLTLPTATQTPTMTATLPTYTVSRTSTFTMPTVSPSLTQSLSFPTMTGSPSLTASLPTQTSSDTATATLPTVSNTGTATASMPTATSTATESMTLPTAQDTETGTLTLPSMSATETGTGTLPSVSATPSDSFTLMSASESTSQTFTLMTGTGSISGSNSLPSATGTETGSMTLPSESMTMTSSFTLPTMTATQQTLSLPTETETQTDSRTLPSATGTETGTASFPTLSPSETASLTLPSITYSGSYSQTLPTLTPSREYTRTDTDTDTMSHSDTDSLSYSWTDSGTRTMTPPPTPSTSITLPSMSQTRSGSDTPSMTESDSKTAILPSATLTPTLAPTLVCSSTSTIPVTDFTCVKNSCGGGIDASTVTSSTGVSSAVASPGAPATVTTGDLLPVGGTTGFWINPRPGYQCNTTQGSAACLYSGTLNQAVVTGVSCDPKQCPDVTAVDASWWQTQRIEQILSSAEVASCDDVPASTNVSGCTATCLPGYAASGSCTTKLNCIDPDPTVVTAGAPGAWQVAPACQPITCNIAALDAAQFNVVQPTASEVLACDAVPEAGSPCTLTCADGFVATASGPNAGRGPQLTCVQSGCGTGTWAVTNHCVATCSPSAAGGTLSSNTGSSCTTLGCTTNSAKLRSDNSAYPPATCTASPTPTGWILRPNAATRRCDAPPGSFAADPARDCSLQQCCVLSCGLFPACPSGYDARTPAATFACDGPTVEDCLVSTCCSQKTCSPLNTPTHSGATINCNTATAHGQDCAIIPDTGYVCTGTVGCTAASSASGGYASTFTGSTLCTTAPCPDRSSGPPSCNCDPGYAGTASWGGTAWTHTCVAQQCARSSVANSRDFSTPQSLSGTTDQTIPIVCLVGYTASATTTTCRGATLTFDAVTCDAQPCLATAVANSDKSTTGAITGSTGSSVAVTCNNGYVGVGAGCPTACAATCDGTSFSTVTCVAASCPANSGPSGTCTCDTGYSVASGTVSWDSADGKWTHVCLATCGLYTCTRDQYSLLQPPVSFLCPTTSASSCTDTLCCRGAVITPTSGLVTSETGTTAQFTVMLVSQPSAPVTLGFTIPDNTAEGRLSANTLIFSSANWNIRQTVTITGVDDNIEDGDKLYRIESVVSISSDSNYHGLKFDDISVTNTDNDRVGVTVDPTSGLVTTEAGDKDVFSVVLNSEPTDDVRITVKIPDSQSDEGRLSTTGTSALTQMLTFIPAFWNIPQTVTVTGQPDSVDDGNVAYVIDVGPASSSDPKYNQLGVSDVTVTNMDNDARGVIVTPTSGLRTTEAGGTASFTVRLNSQPLQTVTIGVRSSNVNEGTVAPSSISFFTSDWNVAQTIVVSGVQDSVDDDDVIYTIILDPAVSADGNYNGLDPADVTATNVDDDTRGAIVSPVSGLETSELGRTALFTVRLETQPVSNVVFDFSTDATEGTLSESSVTFTPSNWDTPKSVTITGVDDKIADGDVTYTVLGTATSEDPKYNGYVMPEVTVVNVDDDVVGVSVTPTAGLVTTEAGASANFTVVLNSEPTAGVTISLSGDPSEGVVTPTIVSFNSMNWATPQTVTIVGVQDLVDDGDVVYSVVTAPAISADSGYSGFDPPDVTVTNVDDDTRGITVTPTTGLRTTELGGSDQFTVKLDSEPTATVTVPITSGDTTEGSVSPDVLIFTVTDWNILQTVIVTGVQDDIPDGNVPYTVMTGNAVSDDPVYSGFNAADVLVTNKDDDTPGITVEPTSGLVVSETGLAATFTVVLDSMPTSNVDLSFVTDATEARLSPDSLRFTPADWLTPKTVSVIGVDDVVEDGNVTFSVETQPAQSADPNYNGRNALDVSVVCLDNDKAGVVVSPTAGLETSEAGKSATFTVVLQTAPIAIVSIDMTGDPSEGVITPRQITFESSNWNVVQTVTVTGADDDFADGDITYNVTTSPGGSTDTSYSGLRTPQVRVTNLDNDTAGFNFTPSSGLWTTERGAGSATFTVRLTSRPTAQVSIGMQSDDTTEGTISPTTITFQPLEWNVPKTATITGVDDFIDDGNVSYQITSSTAISTDLAYSGMQPPAVSVTNADDDVAGVTVIPTTGLTTTEGGGIAEFTVRLDTEPVSDVTVGLESGDLSEGDVSPQQMVFTAANWQSPQTATITGVDDAIDDGNITYTIITKPTQSADPRYDGFNPVNVMANNTDDDTAGVVVQASAGLTTTEAGGIAEITIVLATEPTSPVSIGVSTNDTSEGLVNPRSVTFSSGSWNVLQTITVTGVDDVIDDGDVAYNVTFSAASSNDVKYAGMRIPDVTLVNSDDDTPDIIVSPTVALVTTEAGGTAEFTARLGSQPDAAVTIDISSTDVTEGRLAASSLIFTTTGWNTLQTVVVTGVDDFVADGDVPFTIVTAPAVSADVKYNRLNAADVSVTNQDDDEAGISLCCVPNEGFVTSEDGLSQTFTVELTSEPTSAVSIGVSSTDTTEGVVSPTNLVFSASSWNVKQTVTITGVSDFVQDGDVVYTVATSAAISADGKYDGMNAIDVTVVNRDDDTAGVLVEPSSGLVTTEAGGTATFTVALQSEPTAVVNIAVSSSDTTEGTTSTDQLVFIPANWRTVQTVTVTGVDDVEFDGNVPYEIVLEPAQSDDTTYNGMNPVNVQVTNADDDAAAIRIQPTTGLVTEERGTTATFSVRLESRPTSDVTIEVVSRDRTEGTLSPSQLVFAPDVWNVEQVVTVTGVDDSIDDGDVTFAVGMLPSLSQDGNYNGLTGADVMVTNVDDETRGVSISAAGTGVTVSDSGQSATFTVKLDSEPTAGVMVRLVSTDPSEGVLEPAFVLFTAQNWNIPANVTVRGVPDGVGDGDAQFGIRIESITSDDPLYNGLSVPDVPVTSRDAIDECVQQGVVCTAQGQACRDPDTRPTSINDWVCECVGSSTGINVAGPASCSFTGECGTRGSVCTAAGQSCVDPSPSISGDWQCVCVPPEVGVSVTGGSAACTVDECLISGTVCTAVGQTCVDPNPSPASRGDWECRCPDPLIGTAVAGQAACDFKGECVANSQVCTNAGQTCDDPTTLVSADWACVCLAPAVGRATAATATCVLDECSLYGDVCTAAGQQCNDPNTDASVTGDWTCDCVGSLAKGSASAMPAACVLDECETNGATCLAAGQTCEDPNKQPESVNDWTCRCVAPAVGSQVGGRAACAFSGECVSNAHICTAAGQTCSDPDQAVAGDWECVCVPPNDRTTAVAARAVCVLDECRTNGDVCAKMGQLCRDPNTDPASANDWLCECVPPAVGSARGVATCVYQGECAENAAVCTAAGQTCRDQDVTQAGDWQCLCVAPQTGSAIATPATCILDECLVEGALCSEVGQQCSDPNTSPSSRGDWTCNCVAPAAGTARARQATCAFRGECVSQSQTCTSMGQTCNDPDTTKVGDWQCVCLSPSTGSATGAAAQCVLNECNVNAAVCTAAGQVCADPNPDPRSLGDWTCSCVGGFATGTAVGGPATCILDECRSAGATCQQAGQLCEDPDTSPASVRDWRCRCPSPAVGTAVGQQAACAFSGECASQADICVAAGQTCVDPDEVRSGNWECRCVAPQTGYAVATPAACVLDECTTNGEVCTKTGQTCNDPNTSPTSTGDWICSCVGSGSGAATAAAAICQHTGECAVRARVCAAAGQACSDPDASRTGDWECRCVPPYTGRATAGKAECRYDECAVHGNICTGVGQKCTDPSPFPESQGDWTCSCTGSAATGTAVGRPATCELNECTLYGAVCNAAGQVCEDVNPDPSSKDDWQCVCVSPATGTAKAARATCAHVGECVANAQICAASGQACIDPNPQSSGDWRCACLAPLQGTAAGRAAVCLIDECVQSGDAVCRASGQVCTDPSTAPASLNDWTCNCVAPAVGSALGSAARCQWKGECELHAQTCTKAGQTCDDPDTTTPGDWRCVCVHPQVGFNVGGAASRCSLDECVVNGKVCAAAGQTCRDPDTNPFSLDDWMCECVSPSRGSARARAANCAFQGECIVNAGLCTSVGQTCADPSATTAGDWECRCVAPRTGKAVGRQATCILDECLLYSSTCTSAAQRCTDPNTSPASTGDWVCECIGSASGQAVAAAASCNYPGACSSGGQVCVAAGQACFIPDGAPAGEFQCVCVPPQTGARALGTATCTIDECTIHGSVCRAAGQTCTDPNTSPDSVGDWKCVCVSAIGEATAAAAQCTFSGECVANSPICVSAGQTCRDPDATKVNDWQCVCVAPSIGTATRQAATCELDECAVHGGVCTSVKQTCHDPTPVVASQDDWVCECAGSSATGTAVGRAATCELDECLVAGVVCQAAGQECVDTNKDPVSLGDWQCNCVGTSVGTATAGVATCTGLAECATNSAVCAAAGQSCVDPDSSRSGDWQCACVSPQTGTSATASAAICILDECSLHGGTCTGVDQICRDPNTDPSSVGDWRCSCREPLTGSQAAAAATCSFVGECVSSAVTCTSAGQTCRDPDLTKSNDWECVCVAPQTGSPSVTSAANCILDECTVRGNECSSKGQTCMDSNTSPASPGDWICTCVPPATGSATAMAAVCVHTGECAVHASTCQSAGQTCIDPSTATTGDWQCVCVPPATGRGAASPAVCVLNECSEFGSVCAAVGQTCIDDTPTPDATGDWQCQCVAPATGAAVGEVAVCAWPGECAEQHTVCQAAGQTCDDPTANAGDWECVCVAPRAGRATARTATCTIDECAEHGATCTAVGQNCVDSRTSSDNLGDWMCTCSPPAVGSATAGLATCVYDECITNGQVCSAVNQVCEDLALAETGDWRCKCVAPQTGSARAAPAVCTLDECTTNGRACTTVGQLCTDPNTAPDSVGDWQCRCAGSGTGTATARTAVCAWTGECATNAGTCTAAGQTCFDVDAGRTGDWECQCVSPLRGSATSAVAACVFDECAQHQAECTNNGQLCRDPNTDPQVLGDWYCSCVAPATGQATARAATCVLDECQREGRVCLSFGQTCRDASTDPASTGDWTCSCAGSARGAAVGSVAACISEGECATNGLTCAAAGQSCTDPSPLTAGDWRCDCVPPATGDSVTRGPASCTYDECVRSGALCLSAGQTCRDPNKSPTSTGDWTCSCGGSATGTAVAGLAVCAHTGECVVNSRTCTTVGQECVDPDAARSDDWECVCVSPAVGRSRTGPAQCVLDECLSFGNVCTAAGQTCTDANTNPLSSGDWRCTCSGSSGVGSARARAATCVLDECLTAGLVCTRAGQECVDLNTSPGSTGDWECRCAGSSAGQQRGGPAQCTSTGECVANANTCRLAGQACSDPDPTKTGDWQCVCVGLQQGRAGGRAAVCTLDECMTSWSVCAAAGQTCRDPNTSPDSTGDWVCDCVPPATGTATAGAASCAFAGECAQNSAVCTSNGQTCEDPDFTRTGDWRCVCVEPEMGGSATGGPARCTLDECSVAGAACLSNGQACVDPNRDPASTGDWRCECVAPSQGSAVGRAAVCTFFGECTGGPGSTCAAAGQACNDPTETTNAADWECVCVPPAVGRATAKAAECTLDECSTHGTVCTSVQQVCVDPNTDASSTGDWRCDCVGLQGSARGRAAICLSDECDAQRSVCSSIGQACTDPNPSPLSTSDWMCQCVGSARGSAVGRPAVCEHTGECAINGNAAVCAAVGQACIDPDQQITGDWRCFCIEPQSGSQQQGPAACVLDECIANRAVCAAVGQTCRDPNVAATSTGDWLCECGGSGTGSAVARVAVCSHGGECAQQSDTCTSASQECVDPSTATTGDWQCRCVSPALGNFATGAPAACTLDECTLQEQVCNAAGQTCRDPNTNAASIGDWICSCEGSGVGSARAKPAMCAFNGECATVSSVCTAVGQTCRDPDPTITGDWQCVCVAPRSGSATGAPALCAAAGECIRFGSICTNAGQSCVDPDLTRVGDWQCHCVSPLRGTAVGRVASCTVPTTPAPAGVPTTVVSVLLTQSGTASQLRQQYDRFVAAAQQALLLANTPPRRWTFILRSRILRAAFSEASVIAAVVRAANLDPLRTTSMTSADVSLNSWLWRTTARGRRGRLLQEVSADAEFELIGGSDSDRAAWQSQVQRQETALTQDPALLAEPASLNFTGATSPTLTGVPALTAVDFVDTADGVVALLRIQQAGDPGGSAALQSTMTARANQNVAQFAAAGFPASEVSSALNDCTTHPCGSQTCTDTGTADGAFMCACPGGSPTARNRPVADCNVQPTPFPPSTPRPPTPPPGTNATPRPPGSTPVPNLAAAASDDDSILGVSKGLGIVLIVLIAVLGVCSLGLLFILSRKKGERDEKDAGPAALPPPSPLEPGPGAEKSALEGGSPDARGMDPPATPTAHQPALPIQQDPVQPAATPAAPSGRDPEGLPDLHSGSGSGMVTSPETDTRLLAAAPAAGRGSVVGSPDLVQQWTAHAQTEPTALTSPAGVGAGDTTYGQSAVASSRIQYPYSVGRGHTPDASPAVQTETVVTPPEGSPHTSGWV